MIKTRHTSLITHDDCQRENRLYSLLSHVSVSGLQQVLTRSSDPTARELLPLDHLSARRALRNGSKGEQTSGTRQPLIRNCETGVTRGTLSLKVALVDLHIRLNDEADSYNILKPNAR